MALINKLTSSTSVEGPFVAESEGTVMENDANNKGQYPSRGRWSYVPDDFHGHGDLQLAHA